MNFRAIFAYYQALLRLFLALWGQYGDKTSSIFLKKSLVRINLILTAARFLAQIPFS